MNKGMARITIIGLLGLILICTVMSRFGHATIMLPLKHTTEFASENIATFPSRLHVSGNQIADEEGRTIVLQGIMPPDPAVLDQRGHFNHEFFSGIQATNSNVIRIPVHPENWVKDKDYLWRYLDPIVRWAGELGMYVVIDWHYIGNVATGAGPQMPEIDNQPKELTIEFWQLTADYFRNTPNVIFEIFNEPQNISADEWRRSAGEIVTTIRAQGSNKLIIVGGIDYGKDLAWVIANPISDGNLAYASHIYPVHSSSMWANWFGKVAEKYPVVITEWGFMDQSKDATTSYLVGTPVTYGIPFLDYLEARNISWIACWYDDEWLPPMFTEGDEGYTAYGEFVMQKLKIRK
jgi:aryl-phospho-beta-D-glucosidase BglC (GH1 family)